MPDDTGLDSQARNRLIAIIRASGAALIDDPAQLERQLASYGSYETEYALLLRALEYRVPHDLAAAPHGPVNRLADFLTRRFSADSRIPFSQAKWAVDSWALALDKEMTPPDALGESASVSLAAAPAPPSAPQFATPPDSAPMPSAQNPEAPLAGTPPTQPGWRQSPAPQGWQQPPMQPGVWPPPAYDQNPQFPPYAGDENTSGTLGPIPYSADIQKWSWGGFGLSWIWLIAHNMVGWAVLLLVCSCIPGAALGAAIYLGISGNRLAWQNRRFESVDHFKTVQKIWGQWAIGILIAAIAIDVLMFVAYAIIVAIGISTSGSHT